MKKIIQLSILLILFCIVSFAQVKDKPVLTDGDFKETLYSKYKKEVQAFNKNDFDKLFFDFFQIQGDKKIILTKEEYYTYTVKIAIYSEKLGLLYKTQKEESQKAKLEWMSKNYQDYLQSKK
ncbi:MAG: hypothetical protein H7239_12900 [Flavobacterium sp.]|nr:hypothetical protein [Flavobacterium sp.]